MVNIKETPFCFWTLLESECLKLVPHHMLVPSFDWCATEYTASESEDFNFKLSHIMKYSSYQYFLEITGDLCNMRPLIALVEIIAHYR